MPQDQTQNDPHVEFLEYKFINEDPTRIYDAPTPYDDETLDVKLHLANDDLTVTMKTHYATEQEAKVLVAPFLIAWEIDQAFKTAGRRAIRFDFIKAKMIDRQPTPGSPALFTSSATVSVTGQGTLMDTVSKYPAPPTGFV